MTTSRKRTSGFVGPPPDLLPILQSLRLDLYLIEASLKLAVGPQLDSWRRAYTHAVFAYIEGVTNWTAHAAFDLSRQLAGLGRHVFSPLELCALEERAPAFADKGTVRAAVAGGPWHERYRFVCVAWARALERPYEFPESDSGWQAFQRALAVRNRLTHPRHQEDLAVSDREFDDVLEATRFHNRADPSAAADESHTDSAHPPPTTGGVPPVPDDPSAGPAAG